MIKCPKIFALISLALTFSPSIKIHHFLSCPTRRLSLPSPRASRPCDVISLKWFGSVGFTSSFHDTCSSTRTIRVLVLLIIKLSFFGRKISTPTQTTTITTTAAKTITKSCDRSLRWSLENVFENDCLKT